MDGSTQGRVLAAAFCGAMLVAADDAGRRCPWRARASRSTTTPRRAPRAKSSSISKRDPAVLRTIVAYDERCEQTVAAERVRLTPEGVLDAGGAFTAFDADGREQAGTWEIGRALRDAPASRGVVPHTCPPGRGAPILLAFMFRARPGPRPRFFGSIPIWHKHLEGGDQMIHVWRTRGVRAAYANCLPVPELARSLRRFQHEDVTNQLRESQPCPQ